MDLAVPPQERMQPGQELSSYWAELVVAAQADPGEDVLGMLVREHGDDITTDELIGIAA